jgi:hypothetical protein
MLIVADSRPISQRRSSKVRGDSAYYDDGKGVTKARAVHEGSILCRHGILRRSIVAL